MVFALKSTIYQWQREIERWDPRATVQVIEGTKPQQVRAIRRSGRFH